MADPVTEGDIDDSSVLIIGAGCSRAISEMTGFGPMPVMCDFLKKSHPVTLQGNPPCYLENYGALWKFVEDFFHIPKKSPSDRESSNDLIGINVEDAMSILEAAAHRGGGFGENMPYDPRVLADVMRSLIYRTIVQYGPFSGDVDALQKLGAANEIVDKIIRKAASANIICMNWDVLFDSAMTRYPALKLWDWDHSYGFTPSLRWQGRRGERERQGDVMIKLRILKLHGSVNWGGCSKCGTMYIYDAADLEEVFKASAYPAKMKRCQRCQANLKIAMVPPTWVKAVESWPFDSVWNRAFHALRQAKRITVIGYSLPSGDYLIRDLLLRARAFNSNSVELTLVDRGDPDVQKDLEQRFRGCLKPAKLDFVGGLGKFLA